MAYASTVGAVVAAILGYGLSLAFSLSKLALIAPPEGANPNNQLFLLRSGLNFLAIQHIGLTGTGASGNAHVSIIWPITVWAILPAVALFFGGFICQKLSGIQDRGNFALGAMIAVPYAILLMVARAFFTVPSAGVKLPPLPADGLSLDPSQLPIVFSATALSTLFHALIFGLIFGGIGAMGIRRLLKGFSDKNTFWPSWARGAAASLVIGQLVFFLLIIVLAGVSHSKNKAWTSASLIPAEAGLAHYLSHGVTLSGSIKTEISMPGAQPTVQSYKAGIFTGTEADGKKKPVPPAARLLLLIPAIALIIGGRLAAKSKDTTPKWRLAVQFAGAYALLLSAVVGLFTLVISSKTAFEGLSTSTSLAVGPSVAQAFAFGLILALIFGFIGAVTTSRNGNP